MGFQKSFFQQTISRARPNPGTRLGFGRRWKHFVPALQGATSSLSHRAINQVDYGACRAVLIVYSWHPFRLVIVLLYQLLKYFEFTLM